MRILISTAAVLLTVGVASAATLNVPSNDYPTIQSAVDAAADGDTIKLGRGPFYESVTVAGTNNLKFLGKKTVWDGTFGGSDNNCLTVTGSGTVVQGITFRFGRLHLIVKGDDSVVQQCVFLGGDYEEETRAALSITGDDAVVQKCRFRGNDEAVEITGDNAVFQKNVVRQQDNNGVTVNGNGAEIVKNTIRTIEDGYGFELNGNDHFVTKNSIFRTDNEGVYANGDRNRVVKNDFRFIDDAAVYVNGDNGLIDRNKSRHSDDGYGIEYSGNNGEVTKNVVQFHGYDDAAIYYSGDGGLVEGNTVTSSADAGIDYSGNMGVVRGNKLSDLADVGIEYSGDDGTIDRNTVEGSAEEGIDYGGARPTVTDNSVTDTFEDADAFDINGGGSAGGEISGNTARDGFEAGFTINGIVDATIADNTAIDCGSEDEAGFDINGSNLIISGNSATGSESVGFRIRGTGNSVTRCVAKDSVEGGFLIGSTSVSSNSATDTTLESCTALGNNGEGIVNNGTGTIVRNSTFRGHRLDVTRVTGKDFATFTGNNFDTGGEDVEPEIVINNFQD